MISDRSKITQRRVVEREIKKEGKTCGEFKKYGSEPFEVTFSVAALHLAND